MGIQVSQDPIDWKDNWVAGTVYKANDLVKYGGNIYLCNTGLLSLAPNALGLEADTLKWDPSPRPKIGSKTGLYLTIKSTILLSMADHYTFVIQDTLPNATTASGLEADQSKWDYLKQRI